MNETKTFTTGKHPFNPSCVCKRCGKEGVRRGLQRANGMANAVPRRRRRSNDLYERYGQLDDIGAFDGPFLNDIDW